VTDEQFAEMDQRVVAHFDRIRERLAETLDDADD